MTDERQTLINLVAGLSLADHMGDVFGDCVQALKEIGIEWPGHDGGSDDHWTVLANWLVANHGAETVWGTSLA